MKKKSFTITALLCFFLGGLGIHRFYTGYIGIGIIQLLTVGGFGIWVLIDIISICLNKYKDSDNNCLDGFNQTIAYIILGIIAFLLVTGTLKGAILGFSIPALLG